MWKLANVAPISKKSNKQLIKKIETNIASPCCGKILENMIFNNLYTYLHTNNLITKIIRAFVQAIPQLTAIISS